MIGVGLWLMPEGDAMPLRRVSVRAPRADSGAEEVTFSKDLTRELIIQLGQGLQRATAVPVQEVEEVGKAGMPAAATTSESAGADEARRLVLNDVLARLSQEELDALMAPFM